MPEQRHSASRNWHPAERHLQSSLWSERTFLRAGRARAMRQFGIADVFITSRQHRRFPLCKRQWAFHRADFNLPSAESSRADSENGCEIVIKDMGTPRMTVRTRIAELLRQRSEPLFFQIEIPFQTFEKESGKLISATGVQIIK